MTEDLLDYWLRLIKPLFPAHAWFTARLSGDDYLIQIDWKTGGEPNQTNRRSRKIELIIKEEVIDSYLLKDQEGRALFNMKLQEWISGKYKYFILADQEQSANPATAERWRLARGTIT